MGFLWPPPPWGRRFTHLFISRITREVSFIIIAVSQAKKLRQREAPQRLNNKVRLKSRPLSRSVIPIQCWHLINILWMHAWMNDSMVSQFVSCAFKSKVSNGSWANHLWMCYIKRPSCLQENPEHSERWKMKTLASISYWEPARCGSMGRPGIPRKLQTKLLPI